MRVQQHLSQHWFNSFLKILEYFCTSLFLAILKKKALPCDGHILFLKVEQFLGLNGSTAYHHTHHTFSVAANTNTLLQPTPTSLCSLFSTAPVCLWTMFVTIWMNMIVVTFFNLRSKKKNEFFWKVITKFIQFHCILHKRKALSLHLIMLVGMVLIQNLDKIYFRWEMIKYFYIVYNVSYSVLLLGRNKIGIEANRLLKHASTTQFLYLAVSLISWIRFSMAVFYR